MYPNQFKILGKLPTHPSLTTKRKCQHKGGAVGQFSRNPILNQKMHITLCKEFFSSKGAMFLCVGRHEILKGFLQKGASSF